MGIIRRSVIAPVAGAIAAGATRGGTPSGRLTSLPGSDGPIAASACAQRRSRCKPGRAAGIVGAVPGARARRLRHG